MPDYNLSGLDTRTFQQLVQAIAIKEVGPGVLVYGDGRDGARDAAFTGRTIYPSAAQPWDGHLIIQAKYRQRPTGEPKKDGAWTQEQLVGDLDKFINHPNEYKPPDYYILATNIDLTPVPEIGTEARIRKVLAKYANKLGIKGYDVWDGNKIRRYLDGHRDIAATYGGYITTGDVLARMRDWIEGLQPSFDRVAADYLQGELVADQYARLREAGSASERKTPLARVFIDLPVAEELSTEEVSSSESVNFAEHIIAISSLRMDRKSVIERRAASGKERKTAAPEDGRFVLIGGPGQGKSTLGQFVCQLYRAAILRDRPRETLSENCLDALETLLEQCRIDKTPQPSCRRFPVRIDLKHFADNLAKSRCTSILEYISQRIDSRSAEPVDRNDLQTWIATYPWLLVLDGLDEVPASSNRSEVLDSIAQFSSQCATRGADVVIVSTSRPQGYGNAFETHLYCHRFLLPLSTDKTLHYAQRLVENLHPGDLLLRADVMARLRRAVERPTTQRLMRTPLQVTIMAILAELSGELPDDRWELFRSYYKTIFDRETQRGIIPLSTILSKHRRAIDKIHRHAGLRLQVLSETAGHNNASLRQSALIEIISNQFQNSTIDELERSWTVDQLAKAALDRLVFLVSPREEEIGFEIRSLQEFMAAEALMEGTDEQIRKRLESIAQYPHWRNVFLFAAGKCASERDYIIPDIVMRCQTLSDPSDPAAAATMAGARLALDLIEDDTFRDHLKEYRVLAEIALKLFDLPPSDEHVRLAFALRPNRGLEPVYAQAIRRALLVGNIERQLSAWTTLIALTSRDQEWATKIADENWPSDPGRQVRIIKPLERFAPVPWMASKHAALIPQMSPFEVGFIARRDSAPAWLTSIQDAIHVFGRIAVPIRIASTFDNVIQFELVEWQGKKAQRIANLADMPHPSREWYPIVSYARICRNPTRESFSKELTWLADHGWPDKGKDKSDKFWEWFVGWPLSTCINGVHSSAELRGIADRIASGELEGPDQFSALENKWREGVSLSDVIAAVAQPSFSFQTAWLHTQLSPSDSLLLKDALPSLQVLAKHYAELSSQSSVDARVRERISTFIVGAMYWRASDNDEATLKMLAEVITPALLSTWLAESSIKWISANAIDILTQAEGVSPRWVDFLERTGKSNIRIVIQSQREISINSLSRLASEISSACNCDETRTGLVRLLSFFAAQGIPFPLPLFRQPRSDFDEKSYGHIATILLAQGNMNTEDARVLARDLHRLQANSEWLGSAGHLRRILRPHLGADWLSTFLIELATSHSCDIDIEGMSIALLNELLSGRKSPLHSREHVADLGLSEMVT